MPDDKTVIEETKPNDAGDDTAEEQVEKVEVEVEASDDDKVQKAMEKVAETVNAIAKAAGIYVMPAAIIGLFYAYTAITGSDNLIADITIFVVAIALGQLASYKVLNLPQLSRRLYILAVVGLVALGVIYALFTFYPPQASIFMESATGTYGIP